MEGDELAKGVVVSGKGMQRKCESHAHLDPHISYSVVFVGSERSFFSLLGFFSSAGF